MKTEIDLNPSLTAMSVIAETKDAVYVRLPNSLQRPIEGGCDCLDCRAKPDHEPKWDTLVVPTKALHGFTYTVHMPNPYAFRVAIVANDLRKPLRREVG